MERLEALAGDPRPSDCTKLSGVEGLYRVREGEYRLTYTVSDDLMIVLALSVGHRRDAYKHLRELERLARSLLLDFRQDAP